MADNIIYSDIQYIIVYYSIKDDISIFGLEDWNELKYISTYLCNNKGYYEKISNDDNINIINYFYNNIWKYNFNEYIETLYGYEIYENFIRGDEKDYKTLNKFHYWIKNNYNQFIKKFNILSALNI